MAKNFGKAGSANKFKEVEKLSAEKAQVITLQMINTENLLDYSKNGEDIEDTLDLENSIKELGFTDPIEVTGFGMDEGKYMIVSGHRRRAAGVKTGMELFPCIVRNFKSEEDVRNYVLLSNSQRDSAKDPLLFVKRYKMHEEYLKESNFSGNIREEIAKRLGISVQQADRYKQFNKIILPVWDMVRNEEVGMSSVLPMATLSPDEQVEIYEIMQEAMKEDVRLNRETVKSIVDKYKLGARSFDDVMMPSIIMTMDADEPKKAQTNTKEKTLVSDSEPVEGQTTMDDYINDVLEPDMNTIEEDKNVDFMEDNDIEQEMMESVSELEDEEELDVKDTIVHLDDTQQKYEENEEVFEVTEQEEPVKEYENNSRRGIADILVDLNKNVAELETRLNMVEFKDEYGQLKKIEEELEKLYTSLGVSPTETAMHQ